MVPSTAYLPRPQTAVIKTLSASGAWGSRENMTPLARAGTMARTPTAMGSCVDGELLVFPIENGPGGEFAGDDLLVVLRQPGGVDVEQGGELAGKGKLGVLAHGAGAHRQPGGGQDWAAWTRASSRSGGSGAWRIRAWISRLTVLRLSRSWMGAWESLASSSPAELGPFQKALVGRGGDGKALGHRQADAVADLPQVGHLAAHRRGQVPVQGRQGQDVGGFRDGGDRGQLLVDFFPEAPADGTRSVPGSGRR